MRRLLLSLLSVVALTLSASAAEKSAVVKDALQPFIDSGDLAGVVTFVGNKDGIVDVQVLGMANLENKVPMKRDTIFRIASMTKPIVGLAVMQLAEAGKLDINDPVEKYLPEFKGQMLVSSKEGDTITLKKSPRPITIRDLLTHTSGLPGYPPGMANVYRSRDRNLNDTTIAVSQQPLMFEPGTKWSYCNPGIDTLGRIIEVVSNAQFDSYLQLHIFQPLGMVDTTPYPSADQLKRTALTYAKKDGKLVASTEGPLDYPATVKHPVPAGGLFSTGDDLARLYQCLLNKGKLGDVRIIREETLAEMTKNQTADIKTGFIDGSCWGLAFSLVREPKGPSQSLSAGSFGHGGAYGTQGWMDPTKGLFTILLIQRTGVNSDGSAMRKALHDASVKLIE